MSTRSAEGDRESILADEEGEKEGRDGDENGYEEGDEEQSQPDPPILSSFVAAVGWILLSAAVFCLWEDWDFFTSVYFFVISLSTIGKSLEIVKEKVKEVIKLREVTKMK